MLFMVLQRSPRFGMRATGFSSPTGDKNFGKGRFRFAPMCNLLKSHKTAKELGTRPRDAGAPFATLEARRGSGPPFVGQAANLCLVRGRLGFGRKRPARPDASPSGRDE